MVDASNIFGVETVYNMSHTGTLLLFMAHIFICSNEGLKSPKMPFVQFIEI